MKNIIYNTMQIAPVKHTNDSPAILGGYFESSSIEELPSRQSATFSAKNTLPNSVSNMLCTRTLVGLTAVRCAAPTTCRYREVVVYIALCEGFKVAGVGPRGPDTLNTSNEPQRNSAEELPKPVCFYGCL